MEEGSKANRRDRSQSQVDVDRKRNKQNLIILEYVVGETMLKGIQLRSSRVSTMGMPQGGMHYFFPEEAVWLMETAHGSVVHNGLALSVQQGYRLLEWFGIAWPQYAVYSYLKRAGYIVLPYNRPLPTTQEYLKEPECSAEGKSAVRFPSTLLDQFPSMKDDRRILFSSLHKQSSVANKFDISEHFPSPSAHRFKSDRRDIHKEWVRPRYWPRLDNLARKAVDWSVYRNERARLLKQSTAEQSPLQFSSLSLNVDYSVYAGDGTYKHTLIPPPLFLLLVVKDLRNNFPSSANLHALSAELHGQRLVLAIAHYAAVLFYDIDYRPIQL